MWLSIYDRATLFCELIYYTHLFRCSNLVCKPEVSVCMSTLATNAHREDHSLDERTDVLPVQDPDVNLNTSSEPEMLFNVTPGGQSLCGTTRLFSVFNTRARVAALSDESAACARDGQAATLSSEYPFLPDKRHKAGVG